MEDNSNEKYNIIFSGLCSKVVLQFERETKLKYIIEEYFKKIKKKNLLIKNFDNIYFISNAKRLDQHKEETMEDIYNYLFFNSYNVEVINGREDDYNYKIIEPIKENVYTSVYKARKIKQHESDSEPDTYVAIKKIFIDKLNLYIQNNFY